MQCETMKSLMQHEAEAARTVVLFPEGIDPLSRLNAAEKRSSLMAAQIAVYLHQLNCGMCRQMIHWAQN
jgi:hypothetical protein